MALDGDMKTVLYDFKAMGKKISLITLIKLLAALLSFGFYFLLARQLSVAEFGLFNLVLTCALMGAAVVKQGVEPASVRFFASIEPSKVYSLYIYILLLISLYLGVVGGALWLMAETLFYSILETPELLSFLPLIIGLISTQVYLAVNSSVLKGCYSPVSSMLFSGFLTYLIACCLLYLCDVKNAHAAAALFLVASAIATVFSFVWMKKNVLRGMYNMLPFRESGIIRLNKTSRILFVSSFSSLLTQQFAVLVLAHSVSLEELGRYSIALKVSLLMGYPLVILNALTAPQYAALYARNDMLRFKQLAMWSTKLLAVVATLLLLFVCIFAKEIVFIFGEEYASAVSILVILAIGQWFNLATGPVITMLVMAGYEKIHRRNAIVMAIFTVFSTSVLVPIYGVMAAACLSTITISIFNLLSLYFVKSLIYSRHIV